MKNSPGIIPAQAGISPGTIARIWLWFYFLLFLRNHKVLPFILD
jgi:hypothetical protein